MSSVVLILLTGVGLGALYFLVASGLSLIYGLMHVLNFAHGAFLTLSAFIGWQVAQALGTSSWGSFLVSILVGAVVGEFVGSNSGIGYVMQRSIGTFDLPTMFAALVILALLGVVLFWIVDRIEKLVIPWHVSQREDVIFAS